MEERNEWSERMVTWRWMQINMSYADTKYLCMYNAILDHSRKLQAASHVPWC
jgi:hypothetical protein